MAVSSSFSAAILFQLAQDIDALRVGDILAGVQPDVGSDATALVQLQPVRTQLDTGVDCFMFKDDAKGTFKAG